MSKYKIVIDPGHGGVDRANRGVSGKYIEADGNLKFALDLKAELQNDFDVILTREKDMTLSLTERGKVAKGADMFISIHSDAGAPTAGGVTMLGSVKLNNKAIGEAIGKAVAESQGIKYRGFRQRESEKYPGQDYYTVIGTAQNVGCKCVLLIERGFHSNLNEEKLLLDVGVVKRSAEAAAKEIRKYFSIKEVVPSMGRVFKDVEDSRWSANHIEAAKDLGLINGNPDGTFIPTGNVTREQLAVVVVKLYEVVTGRKVVKE